MTVAELGSRQHFEALEFDSYLNHAAVSPPSRPVLDAVSHWMDTYARLGLGAVPPAMAQRQRLKEKLATLVGCEAGDLALTTSTSRGLMDLAGCLAFEAGDKILCFGGEFPTNVTPWVTTAANVGAEVVMLEQEGVDDPSLLSAIERALAAGGVRLVAVSAVQFATGRVMPLARIVELAHQHDAQVCVDGIQAVGVMPFDVVELGIDYLACGAHKWLMGIEGVGFFYAAPSRVQGLRPATAGWLSHENALSFLFEGPGNLRYDRPLKTSIDFMEAHSMSAIGSVALEASLDLIMGLGVQAIEAHVRSFNDALEAGLTSRGFESLRAAASPSGTLSVMPPAGGSSVEWTAHLNSSGVAMSGPDGKLRFSPHWPNHLDEVPRILEVVDAGPKI